MGTYTTNYQLYIPTVGEQGWGTLVNGNFTTIDTTMDNLNTRLTAVESEVNGDLNCTSVTTSGTITSTGKVTANGGIGTTSLTTSSTITSTGLITANGGVKGNLTGNVTGNITGKLAGTRSTSTSAPFTHENVTLLTLPNGQVRIDNTVKTWTIPAIPSTVKTPYGTFTITRPTLSVTYTFKYGAATGSTGCVFEYDGTQVGSSRFSSGKTYSFTISVDTSKSHTLTFTLNASGYGTINGTPSVENVYMA